jgi:hypothetical protein
MPAHHGPADSKSSSATEVMQILGMIEGQIQAVKKFNQQLVDEHGRRMERASQMLKLKDQELDLKKTEIEVLRRQLHMHENRRES